MQSSCNLEEAEIISEGRVLWLEGRNQGKLQGGGSTPRTEGIQLGRDG